ncbi:MAG: radical SAM protein, partial [Bryobacteraceae bacterium]
MGVIVVELTNRCNLACGHCLPGRHGGGEHLPLEALSAVLRDGAALGFDRLSFTGGEPTMHPQFGEVLRRTDEAGYRFGIVTNGWNFGSVYAKLLEHRNALTAITFSLDGATEAAHDRLRGAGSYRRVLKAFSICVAMEIPFTINMSITGWNRDELEPMAALAAKL